MTDISQFLKHGKFDRDLKILFYHAHNTSASPSRAGILMFACVCDSCIRFHVFTKSFLFEVLSSDEQLLLCFKLL